MSINNCGKSFLNCLLAQGDGRINPENFAPKALTNTGASFIFPSTGNGGARGLDATSTTGALVAAPGNGFFFGLFDFIEGILDPTSTSLDPPGISNFAFSLNDVIKICGHASCNPDDGFVVEMLVTGIGDDGGVSAAAGLPDKGAMVLATITSVTNDFSTMTGPPEIAKVTNKKGVGKIDVRGPAKMRWSQKSFERLQLFSNNNGLGFGGDIIIG